MSAPDVILIVVLLTIPGAAIGVLWFAAQSLALGAACDLADAGPPLLVDRCLCCGTERLVERERTCPYCGEAF